jgi:hypothetical protein
VKENYRIVFHLDSWHSKGEKIIPTTGILDEKKWQMGRN